MTRIARLAYWSLPSLICLLLYWYGLRAWFQQDDFAWLGLHLEIHQPSDWLPTLFEPKAQGTIRPWSERLLFIGFHHFFGLRVAPFKIWMFLNQCLNLALLCWIVRRLTRDPWAGFAAAVFWACNSALITPLSWTAAYNEIQCSTFMLGAFALLLLYTSTGDRRYYWVQLFVFVLGLGSLELNVVYPALATLYIFFFARQYWRGVLPFWVVSILYTLIHRSFAPRQQSPVYQMYFDLGIVNTLGKYWAWVVGPGRLYEADQIALAPTLILVLIVTALLAVFALRQLRRGQMLGLVFFGWFLIPLAPVLPLKNHVTDYYLTIPAIGLAMLGGWAFSAATRSSSVGRIAASVALAIYLFTSIPVIRAGTLYYFQRGAAIRNVIAGLAYANQKHPNSLLVLKGVDNELFYAGLYDRPFRILGMHNVFLTPDSEGTVTPMAHAPDIGDYFVPAPALARAIEQQKAFVYEVRGPFEPLRNVTTAYYGALNSRLMLTLPRRAEIANPLFASQLGKSWYNSEVTFRWMPREATVRLGGPNEAGQKLRISGYCPPALVSTGPLNLTVEVDGQVVGRQVLGKSVDSFELAFDLPHNLLQRPEVTVRLLADRTFHAPGDPRELSLAIHSLAIR